MTARRGLRWLGAGLTLLALGLLARALAASAEEVAARISDLRVLALALGLSLAYAALLALPALGWARVLERGAPRPGAALAAMGIYARCNVLKYLPGNVFHFGGRQVLARRAGWAHGDTLLASLAETAALPLAAAWVALALLGLAALAGGASGPDFGRALIEGVGPAPLALALGAAAAITAAACVLAARRGLRPAALAAMAGLAAAFFAANAALVAGLAAALAPSGAAELALLAAAYLAGWVAGFLVPGAPGGLGVREALFVELAAGTVSPGVALTLAILTRLVTSLGDLWFALAALASQMPGTKVRMTGHMRGRGE